jgi:hypothetical protein
MVRDAFLRALLGLYCSIAGLISVAAMLASGGAFWEAVHGRPGPSVKSFFLFAVTLALLAVTGLFAQGISRARSGDLPRRLWVGCFLAGLPMVGFVLAFLLRGGVQRTF